MVENAQTAMDSLIMAENERKLAKWKQEERYTDLGTYISYLIRPYMEKLGVISPQEPEPISKPWKDFTGLDFLGEERIEDIWQALPQYSGREFKRSDIGKRGANGEKYIQMPTSSKNPIHKYLDYPVGSKAELLKYLDMYGTPDEKGKFNPDWQSYVYFRR